jgi:Ser/Thr protein kinase RdoA (MazF antagonist)
MLRRLHDLEGLDGEDRRHTAATEAADLASRTDRICTIFPHGASLLSEVRDSLGARAASGLESATARLVHRDFYDKQVLYTAGRTTLLDLDNLASGDPAQDVGNFLAHLELRRLQHSELEPGLARAADAFLDAYGNVDPDFRERVGWWQAATLLRLAGLYALRPRWHHLTLDLAKLARQHLDAATPVFITDKEVV